MFNGFDYPSFPIPDTTRMIESLKAVPIDGPAQHMWADEQYKILRTQIQKYEKSLDSDHEVGLMFTNFGQTILMQVTEISYADPVLMIFKGIVNGREATLIQHVNQLNFLLTSIEKAPDQPKRKIGFVANNN